MKPRIKCSLLIALILSCFISTAQNRNGVNEFEVAIDALELFSEGYPGKVIVKFNKIRGKQSKGALRLGLDTQFDLINTEDTDQPKYEILTQQHRKGSMALLVGYEKHYGYKNLKTYYGIDFKGSFGVQSEIDGEPGKGHAFGAALIPFMGISYPISDRLATSIEMGLENKFFFHEYDSNGNEDMNKSTYGYSAKFALPYSLTLSYTF